MHSLLFAPVVALSFAFVMCLALRDTIPAIRQGNSLTIPPPPRVSRAVTSRGSLEGGQLQQTLWTTDPLLRRGTHPRIPRCRRGLNTSLAWIYVALRVAHSFGSANDQYCHAPFLPFYGRDPHSAG